MYAESYCVLRSVELAKVVLLVRLQESYIRNLVFSCTELAYFRTSASGFFACTAGACDEQRICTRAAARHGIAARQRFGCEPAARCFDASLEGGRPLGGARRGEPPLPG